MKYTKAEMLKYLHGQMPSLNILPVYIVYRDRWEDEPSKIMDEIAAFAEGKELIVRSSSRMEDRAECSNAGKFESVLHVKPLQDTLKEAVEKVFRSYDSQQGEEVLIQPMLSDISRAGVVLTADMDTLADYYIVNFSDGGDSTVVTGGVSNSVQTYVRYKFSDVPVDDLEIKELLDICGDIERVLDNPALDIEFAISSDGTIYIFQVRPIAGGSRQDQEKVSIAPSINRIYKKVKKLSARHPFLLGHTACFGVMPDWNPAEILGIRPKKLSISLYKELITDNVWAHQRFDYGYRDLTMHPLMVSFCGVPYIDTRITFNSFVPKKLHTGIAEKLVDYYLDRLKKYPRYHDKVEFEIVFSCYYFGIRDKLRKLLEHGFNENEITRIEFSLLELTNSIISPETGLYKKDIEKIKILEENYCRIVESDISIIDKIYWLIEECKAYGTLPFAGVARAAFIAVQFLRSLTDMGIISRDKYDDYMNSLETVSKRMRRDLEKYYSGEWSRDDFLEEYGHVRPGTYDIASKRYDEAFETYFGKQGSIERTFLEEASEKRSDKLFSDREMQRIQTELEQNGLLITAQELITFIREAIEGREYIKFVFTKSVSKILQLIEELGKRVDIGREDMAYLDICIVKQLYSDLYAGDVKDIFLRNIEGNKAQYSKTVQIRLPSVLAKPEDVYAFRMLHEEPNYITQKSIVADTAVLEGDKTELQGKIVFIRAADPGYDFLFTKGISGLVTQFGGANSHMAIRCAETGIPAVIGAGEKNFVEWSRCGRILMDCQKKQVVKIR
ncbi:MAG: phosphoenolpyruvate synthase [Lachnospiraceae bacterium]|nr:phosphoenolpyruvate synthase [Lachnospiraceae bacterium]